MQIPTGVLVDSWGARRPLAGGVRVYSAEAFLTCLPVALTKETGCRQTA